MVWRRQLLCLAFVLSSASGEDVVEQLQPPGIALPLASRCGPSSANVVCMSRYASVMPYHFYREGSSEDASADPLFRDTMVPNDTSFDLVAKAEFVVFDHERGMAILGENPTYEFMFEVSTAVHEAPVYVPALNKLWLSTLGQPPGTLPQLVVDLGANPPTLSEYLSDPPVYAPNGGTFYNGLIYWGASGGNNSIGGGEQRPGIRTLDPATNKTVTLLNNYYGYYFNCVDDLFVDRADGSIWFTDPQYSWFERLVDTPPQLRPATYRFDPSTGEVRVVEDSLGQPNGIDMSPDGKTVYISDTQAFQGSILKDSAPSNPWNQNGYRTLYKFDRTDDGLALINKRPIYYSPDGVPDGVKVAANGLIATATAKGVDVLDPYGSLIVRVQTNFSTQNFAWTGDDLTDLWIVGQGGISRVRWNLKGPDLRTEGPGSASGTGGRRAKTSEGENGDAKKWILVLVTVVCVLVSWWCFGWIFGLRDGGRKKK